MHLCRQCPRKRVSKRREWSIKGQLSQSSRETWVEGLSILTSVIRSWEQGSLVQIQLMCWWKPSGTRTTN